MYFRLKISVFILRLRRSLVLVPLFKLKRIKALIVTGHNYIDILFNLRFLVLDSYILHLRKFV